MQFRSFLKFFTLLAALCATSGCSHKEFDDTTVVFNLPSLYNQPPDVVDQSLGKPSQVGSAEEDHISSHPRDMRMYESPKKHAGLTVFFEQSRAVDFVVNFDEKPPSSAVAALNRIGLNDLASPAQVASAATHWRNVTVSSVPVSDIEALGTEAEGFTQINVHAK